MELSNDFSLSLQAKRPAPNLVPIASAPPQGNSLKGKVKTLAEEIFVAEGKAPPCQDPIITLSAGKNKRQIPSTFLASQSNFFARLLATRMIEAAKQIIILRSELFQDRLASAFFLDCLASATSTGRLSSHNLLELLILSDQYGVDWLYKDCLNFISEGLTQHSIVPVLVDLIQHVQLQIPTEMCLKRLSQCWTRLTKSQQSQLIKLADQENLIELKLLCHQKELGHKVQLKWLKGKGLTVKAKGMPTPQLLLILGKKNTSWYQPPLDLEIRAPSLAGKQAVIHWAHFLQKNEHITSISLQDNRICPKGAAALAEALKQNQRLKTLDLSNNQIGTQGALDLAEALSVNTTLQSLTVTGNEIEASGETALLERSHRVHIEL